MTVSELYRDTRKKAQRELDAYYERRELRLAGKLRTETRIPRRTAWSLLDKYMKGEHVPVDGYEHLKRVVGDLSPEFVEQLRALRKTMGCNCFRFKVKPDLGLKDKIKAVDDALGLS